LTITNRPCVPPITELSLLFQIFQLNPRSDSFQQPIRPRIPNNQHGRTIIKLAITKYKSRFFTASRVSFPKPDQLKKYSAINAPLNKLACLKTQQRNQRINSILQSVNVNYSIVQQTGEPVLFGYTLGAARPTIVGASIFAGKHNQ
jgi:hypothetical protein